MNIYIYMKFKIYYSELLITAKFAHSPSLESSSTKTQSTGNDSALVDSDTK